ncbi:MAG: carboxymuconolactone decarboxylase family protein [Acidimicrobiales bacterium]
MNPTTSTDSSDEGVRGATYERLPLLSDDLLDPDQRRVAEALKNGPRKGVVGPFIPLLYAPNISERIEPLGSELRFFGTIDRRVHELIVCFIAARTSNQFEWAVHAPVALSLGASEQQINALRNGQTPEDLTEQESVALRFVSSLIERNEVSDQDFDEATTHFGKPGVVELTAIVGYFVMVCWLLNVAGTPAPGDATVAPLPRP